MSRRPIRQRIASGLLSLIGWRIEGERPEPARFVLIAAPHTSNWDFPLLLLYAAAFDLEIHWMGKHSLFWWPLGAIMKALGGIPVVRHRRENLVDGLVRTFDERDALGLVVPTEGTRGRAEYWKSGFYHIALRAEVPIIMSFLDYAKKEGGFGPAFFPTGDVARDMDGIRAFYAGKQGLHPELFGPIRLREEKESLQGEPPPVPLVPPTA